LALLAGVAALVLMGCAAGNVLMRCVGHPFAGSYEVAGFCCALLVGFSLSETQRKGGHVSVDLVSHRLPAVVNRVSDVLVHTALAVFFVVVAYQTVIWGLTLRRSGEVSETLKVVYYPFVFCLAFGFLTLAVTLSLDAIGFAVKQEQ
jgi:TRAP-type C4-dicarboxylate transport system permease small subunit